MTFFPCLVRAVASSGESGYALGHPLLDRYLEFVAGRTRPNTLRAVAHDLKTFFTVVDKLPAEVFGEPFVPPTSDGSGQDRALLKHANDLLNQAGCFVEQVVD